MANVIRLVNGGTIGVRTGVLQGVGPQGPRGVSGAQGGDGPAGPPGPQGDMGVIMQLQAMTMIVTNNPLAAATDTVLSFGQVYYDDMSCLTSTANVTLVAAGDYMLSVWARFDDAPATAREIWFRTGTTTIARKSAIAGVGAPFYTDLAFPFRAGGGEVVNVVARSGSATAVSMGSLTVTRIGAGPAGPAGVQGPPGPAGATGAQGAQGIPGTVNTGFAKYSDLLPH